MNQTETINIRSEFVNVVLTEALVEAAESMQLRKETLRKPIRKQKHFFVNTTKEKLL